MRFPDECPVCFHALPGGTVRPSEAIARCGGCGEWVTAWPTDISTGDVVRAMLSTVDQTEN